MSDCYLKVKEYAKEKGIEVKDAKLRAFAEEFDKLTKAGLSRDQLQKKLAEFTDSVLQAHAQNKRTEQMMMIAKKTGDIKVMTANIDHLGLYKTVEAWIDGGSLKPGSGTNLDVKGIRASTQVELSKGFRGSLGELRDDLMGGAMDRDTVHALAILRDGGEFPADMPKEAIFYAKQIRATHNKILELKKAMNPYMEGSDEFLFTRAHDRAKITAVGEDEWVKKVYAAYGKNTWPGATPEQKIAYFRNVYSRIEDGRFGSVFDGEESNRLYKMSRGRTFVANDWEAEYNYMKEFGAGTLYDSTMTSIRRSAGDIAILEKFTGKPKTFINDTIDGLVKRLERQLEDPNVAPEQKAKLQSELNTFRNDRKNLEKSIRTALGESDVPARNQLGRRVQGVATWEYVTSLGMSTIASSSDVINAGTIARGLNGKNVFQNAASMIGDYLKYFTASQDTKLKAAEKLHLVLDSVEKNMLRDLGGPEGQPGWVGKQLELYGVLNLLQRHVEAARLATGELVSNILADHAHLQHAELPEVFKQGLLRYGIGEKEWSFYRLGVEDWTNDLKSDYKIKSLNPDSLDSIPDEFVIKYMREIGAISKTTIPVQEMVDRYRYGLSAKIGAMINDHADYGSTSPNTHLKAFMHRGFDINTPEGAALRLVGQFKSASFMQYDTMRRAYYSGTGPKGDWAGVGQMVAGLIFIGAMKEIVREALDGKTAPNPVSPQFATKVVLNSGAGGIIGDTISASVFAQDISGKVKGMGTSILGPSAADVLQGIAIGAQYAQGIATDKKLPHYQASQLLAQNIPGNNIWFLKGALNFYVLNGLRSWAGIDMDKVLNNQERRTAETPGLFSTDQRYFMYKPTESVR